MYGMFCDTSLVGCIAIKSKSRGICFLHRKACGCSEKRHRGYGARLLRFAFERSGKRGRRALIGVMDNNYS